MAENSKIEWCDDTLNFWWGCTHFGAGCTHCYAETLAKRFGDFWGKSSPRLWIKSAVQDCLRLNRRAIREGRPRKVFVNSMSDFFEAHVGAVLDRERGRVVTCDCCQEFAVNYSRGPIDCPLTGRIMRPARLDDLRRAAFRRFDNCPDLQFLLLTKRPENILDMLEKVLIMEQGGSPEDVNFFADHGEEEPKTGLANRINEALAGVGKFANLWLGTSIATQADADRNVPLLRECRDLAPVLFLSVEPLLEAVELDLAGIDWVIVGGESGPHARPCDFAWIGSIIEQCRAAGVAVFVKQLGARPTFEGRGWKFEDKKGGDIHAWPQALRIRQFPEAAKAAI